MSRKEYYKQYRQSEEYKARERERKKLWIKTKEGASSTAESRREPKTRYVKAKYDAGRRKSGAKEFTLTYEEYKILVESKCFYCNSSIENETGSGLDRIDNELGYIPGNVNPCCKECNRIRSKSMDADEFKRQTKLNGRWNKEGNNE